MQNKTHLSLILWIVALTAIGGGIGSLTKPEISAWYNTLHRSTLTPPNYIFPIAWTILYGIIGICGWLIWREPLFRKLSVIKTLYFNAAHLKLELDASIFRLPLNRNFPCSFGRYGYSGRHNNLVSLPKNESSIAANDSLFVMDSICDLLKFLYMAI